MSNSNFSIIEESIGEREVRLIAEGQITAETSEKLKQKLDELVRKKSKSIIINMSGVKFLSSGGIRILIMYYKIMKGKDGKLLIQSPSSNVRNVLGMTALDKMLCR